MVTTVSKSAPFSKKDKDSQSEMASYQEFVYHEIQAGLNRTSISSKLIQQGMSEQEAKKLVSESLGRVLNGTATRSGKIDLRRFRDDGKESPLG